MKDLLSGKKGCQRIRGKANKQAAEAALARDKLTNVGRYNRDPHRPGNLERLLHWGLDDIRPECVEQSFGERAPRTRSLCCSGSRTLRQFCKVTKNLVRGQISRRRTISTTLEDDVLDRLRRH